MQEVDRAWETRGRRQVRKLREKKDWFQKRRQDPDLDNNNTTTTTSNNTTWRYNNTTAYTPQVNINNKDRGPPVTTLYVPATPMGELARRLQDVDNKFCQLYKQGWTKVIERGGTKLKDLVGNKYPWAEVSCARENCLLCRSALTQPPTLPPDYRS